MTILCLMTFQYPQALGLFDLDPQEQITQSAAVAEELMQATAPQNRSLLPNDLQATTRILSSVIGVLENANLTFSDVVSH